MKRLPVHGEGQEVRGGLSLSKHREKPVWLEERAGKQVVREKRVGCRARPDSPRWLSVNGLVYGCCSSIILNSTVSHSQNIPVLTTKVYSLPYLKAN